jgi:hypothetical protein
MTDSSRSLDILGAKPIADAALVVTKGSVDGAGAFLSRICLPVAEEFGLLLKDKVGHWRANNAAKIANKAEILLNRQASDGPVFAHPLLIGRIIEHGSWQDDDLVQNMWAGVLASSCTKTGQDQHNIIYTRLLEQLTTSQAHFIEHICISCPKSLSSNGLVEAGDFVFDISDVLETYGNTDIDAVDVELDHLRQVGLLHRGFVFGESQADIAPTTLCLNFYARCQGYIGSISEYYGVKAEGAAVEK